MARAAILALLGGDGQMNALGVDETNIWSSNATDTPDPNRPFLTINVADDPKVFAGQSVSEYEIWIHVPKSLVVDYGIIDAADIRIRELMLAATHVVGGDGWTMSSASFQGTSGDLHDDGYESLCRRSSYRVASRFTGITP